MSFQATASRETPDAGSLNAESKNLTLDPMRPLLAGAHARGMADALEMAGIAFLMIDSQGMVLHAGPAARALMDYEDDAETLARHAMKIAADICVYTNNNLTVEIMDSAS
jgi:PAS domain-containing protein